MNAKDVILARRMGGGGGGSIPKPLTYDYMPEGYPKKTVQTTVLMGEQEVAFSNMDGIYGAVLTDALNLVEGQTYIVSWDGTEYECVASVVGEMVGIGNPSVVGAVEDTGEPFLYAGGKFGTPDTSPSHTISVKTAQEVVTPMAEEFLPAGGGSGSSSGQFIVVVYNANVAGTAFRSDKTYDEISTAIESGMSVVIHKKENINAANYKVFHHNQTGSGFYRFCRVSFGNKIEVESIGIRMVDGEMTINIQSKEIQILTS